MAIPTQRRIIPRETRLFGSGREQHPIPNLTMIQTDSYAAFLQEELASEKRKDHGLESVLRAWASTRRDGKRCLSLITAAREWMPNSAQRVALDS